MHIESEFQEFGDSSQVRAQQCSIVMFIYAWRQPNNEYDAWLIAAISDWRRAPYIRADSRFATSQWETSLQSNAVSHWLGTNQESALLFALWTPGWCNRWIFSNRCYRKAINSGCFIEYPESKVHGANMGPTWVLSVPYGPHVGPMNLAIRVHILTRWAIHAFALRLRRHVYEYATLLTFRGYMINDIHPGVVYCFIIQSIRCQIQPVPEQIDYISHDINLDVNSWIQCKNQ